MVTRCLDSSDSTANSLHSSDSEFRQLNQTSFSELNPSSFMGVANLFNECRHSSASRRIFSLVASASSSSVAIAFDSEQLRRPKSNPNLRSYSKASRHGVSELGAKQTRFWEILDAVRRNESDFETRLNRANLSLSVASITEIFHALTAQSLPALRFFNWIRESRPNMSRNYEICSLLINNFGRLNDYESMTRALTEFKHQQIGLTRNAFRFLPDDPSLTDSVAGIVHILNTVGGSCRTTGVRALIEKFSTSRSLEMAKFVMRITEYSTSHYNILIREVCRRCDANTAQELLDEMRLKGCERSVASHNLVLSVHSKTVETVEELVVKIDAMDCDPDEITFEIVVLKAISLGRFDLALELVERMERTGLEPRASTHAAFVRAYSGEGRFDEAREYVTDWGHNLGFCLLAELHLKKGRVESASEIVLLMVEKGMKPGFRVYTRIMEALRRSGRIDLVGELENRLSGLSQLHSTDKA